MARDTNYQKLSLKLDAENKGLKDKLAQTKQQLADLKKGTDQVQQGFKQSFQNAPGLIGQVSNSFSELNSTVSSLHPAVLGMSAAIGAGVLAWQDITAYTKEWDGAISDAGRSLTAFRTGFTTFMDEAAEARGKALAEGGLFGWMKEGIDQIGGIASGRTGGMMGAFAGMESLVNDLYITWKQGVIDTIELTDRLQVEQAKQFNIMRDEKTSLEDKQWAIDAYTKASEDIYAINKKNAENEIAYLEKIKQVRGLTLEEEITLREKVAGLAKIERQYQEDIGKIIRQTNKIFKAEQRDEKPNATLEKIAREAEALDKEVMSLNGHFSELGYFGEKLADQMLPLSYEMGAITEETAAWILEMEKINKLKDYALVGIEMFTQLGDALVNTMLAGKSSLMSFGETMKQWAINLIKQLSALLIKAIAVAAILTALGLSSVSFGGIMKNIITGSKTVSDLMDKTPSYAVGTSYVPKTGLAMVHKGEAIIPASQNRGNNLVAVVRGSDLHFIMSEYDRRRSNTF